MGVDILRWHRKSNSCLPPIKFTAVITSHILCCLPDSYMIQSSKIFTCITKLPQGVSDILCEGHVR